MVKSSRLSQYVNTPAGVSFEEAPPARKRPLPNSLSKRARKWLLAFQRWAARALTTPSRGIAQH